MKLPTLRRTRPELILDGLSTAVIVLDEALRVDSLNAAAEHLFAISRRHAIGAELSVAVPHLGLHVQRLREALAAGTGFIERELRLQRNGDEPLTVDCMVTPTMTGKPGLLMEITAVDRHLRSTRDEWLVTSQQASRELVRGLAHEIKNPLGGIRGAAQLLEREFPDSQHREYTRVIIREVDRLQNLVNRMLGPNRAPQKSFINIHEVLEHVRRLIEAEAVPGVTVVRDYDPSVPDIEVDKEQLIQAVLNIARNALQALNGNGRITMRSRTRRQITMAGQRHRIVAQIDIEDSGAGIPEQLLEKIFYPMVTTRAEGTGLGLPIAQYLIHSHGGMIECKSRPGCTVFSIYLPFEQAQ
jgi:two-component system nitrogen regulation sensor histidine kinase GlnL